MTHNLACRNQAARSDHLWTDVEETPDMNQQLRLLCHSRNRLKKEGYVVESLSDRKILEKLRCENCARVVRPPILDTDTAGNQIQRMRQKDKCTYHPDKVYRGAFDCCRTRVFTAKDRGCYTSLTHTIRQDYLSFLHSHWQYHATPRTSSDDIRSVIAIDCEFGTNEYNESELIRLTAVDFFTKETLVDTLVDPLIGMKHYNSKWSGIRKADMDRARRNQTCVFGRNAARRELLQFVGPDTVIVLHGGSGDLISLRLLHPLIIDTHILDDLFFTPAEGGRSLKNLCAKRMNIDVQMGSKGHDSVEDALACRELLLAYVRSLPDDFTVFLVDEEESEFEDEREADGEEAISPLELDTDAVIALRNHFDGLLALQALNLESDSELV